MMHYGQSSAPNFTRRNSLKTESRALLRTMHALMTPQVVITPAYDAINDEKVSIMVTLGFQNNKWGTVNTCKHFNLYL